MRELGGWGLALVAWIYPFFTLLMVAAWGDDEVPGFVFFFTLLLGFAWPGVFLASRRLRAPDDLDVAEADGRAPVLVIASLERVRTPWWKRVFPTPSLFRDIADARLERALRRSLCAVGPVVVVPRPPPPPEHGPVATLPDTAGYEASLRERIGRAALVAIVLDSTVATLREIAIAGESTDVRRVILVAPPQRDARFDERWGHFRMQLPGLPPLDASTAAVRFMQDAAPIPIPATTPGLGSRLTSLGRAALMVRPGEARPLPGPPLVSWIFSLLPVGFALMSAVLTPVLLSEHGLSLTSGDAAGFGFLSLLLGIVLAVMSRRRMQLVPASDVPMVLVAALPWLLMEGSAALEADHVLSLSRHLRQSGQLAGYCAPLLYATSLTLAGASLIRRSPGREPSYGLLGAAAVIPFGVLAMGLGDMQEDTGGLLIATTLTAMALGLATIAASGDAGRRHAPLPLGSAAAAALALTAWASAITHGSWSSVFHADASWLRSRPMEPLLQFDAAWVWFILALPLVVVFVGSQFRGRASKTATQSALALLPLALVLPLATAGHAGARDYLESRQRLFGEGVYAAAGGDALAPGFELARIDYGDGIEDVATVVVDRGGALAEGQRVATGVEMTGFGSGGSPALSRAIGDAMRAGRGDHLGIAVSPDADGRAVLTAARAAWAHGAVPVTLIGQADGRPDGIGVHPLVRYVGPEARIMLAVSVEAERVHVMDSAGSSTLIDHAAGRVDAEALRERLLERRDRDPNRRDLVVVVNGGATGASVMATLSAAHSAGFTILSLHDPTL